MTHADKTQMLRDRESAQKCCEQIMRYWTQRGHADVLAWFTREPLDSGKGYYWKICTKGIPAGGKEP